MSNELLNFASKESIDLVKTIVSSDDISVENTNLIIRTLNEQPTILNHLSLPEVSKLSTLGIDLSQYMSAVHLNNIKVFVVKFASESMMRVSRLIELLNTVENKYYNSVISSPYINAKTVSDVIEKIQESITSSVNLMMKLTDNETLMNLFIVNMTNINDTINENKARGYTSTLEILPLESRKKIDKVISMMSEVLRESENNSNEVIDAEFKETNQ
jgi:ferritin